MVVLTRGKMTKQGMIVKSYPLTLNIVARGLGIKKADLLAAIHAGEVQAAPDRRGVLRIKLEDAAAFEQKLKAVDNILP